VYAPFLHDVVYLYAVIVDEMIQLVLDKRHLIRCELARRGVRRGTGRLVGVDEMIQLGLDYRNGTDVMHRAKNFQFNGISRSTVYHGLRVLCCLAVLDQRVGHTMDLIV